MLRPLSCPSGLAWRISFPPPDKHQPHVRAAMARLWALGSFMSLRLVRTGGWTSDRDGADACSRLIEIIRIYQLVSQLFSLTSKSSLFVSCAPSNLLQIIFSWLLATQSLVAVAGHSFIYIYFILVTYTNRFYSRLSSYHSRQHY